MPPLEVVEKVYKVSRVGGQPFQDNKNSRDDSEAAYSNSRVESLLSREEKVSAAESKMDEDKRIVALPSAASNKRKKVIKCVWCKPRRKRPRLSASKPCASQASEEEDDEETCQEEQDHDGQKSETQQLVVDVSEQEGTVTNLSLVNPLILDFLVHSHCYTYTSTSSVCKVCLLLSDFCSYVSLLKDIPEVHVWS